MLYERGPVVAHIVNPLDGVIFNVWRPDCALPWRGERYAIVMYTGVTWDKVPAVLQRRIYELNIHSEHIFFISAHFLLFVALRARYAPRRLVQVGHFRRLSPVERKVARANKIMHFGTTKHARAMSFALR